MPVNHLVLLQEKAFLQMLPHICHEGSNGGPDARMETWGVEYRVKVGTWSDRVCTWYGPRRLPTGDYFLFRRPGLNKIGADRIFYFRSAPTRHAFLIWALTTLRFPCRLRISASNASWNSTVSIFQRPPLPGCASRSVILRMRARTDFASYPYLSPNCVGVIGPENSDGISGWAAVVVFVMP